MFFMNPILLIILVICCFIVFYLSWKVLKSILKAAFSVVLLVLFLTVLFTGIAVYDLNNLRKSLQYNISFEITREGTTLTGIDLKSNGDDTFILEEGYNKSYVNGGLKLTLDVDYLTKNQSVEVLDFGITLTERHLVMLYEAENIGEVHLILEDAGNLNQTRSQEVLTLLVSQFMTVEDFQKAITVTLLTKKFRSDYNKLIQDIRFERISTEPEFVSMKIIRNMPNFLANRLIGDN